MLIAARNAILTGGAALPYDAEVEFLESTGTQWIDTGVAPTIADITRVVADLSFVGISTSVNNIVFGSHIDVPAYSRLFAFVDASGKARVAYGSAYSGTVAVNSGTRYSFDAVFGQGNSYLDVSGTRSSAGSGTVGVLPSVGMALFACRYRDTVISPVSIRLYACEIHIGGVLVRDFIPVRVGSGSSAVGYMYDRVSGALFRNAGTGAFVIGPDK